MNGCMEECWWNNKNFEGCEYVYPWTDVLVQWLDFSLVSWEHDISFD